MQVDGLKLIDLFVGLLSDFQMMCDRTAVGRKIPFSRARECAF